MPTDPTDQTILTKWGRITAQEWIRRRFYEGMAERFDPACIAYLQANWPTPEQIAANRQARSAKRKERETERKKRLKINAISDCARADGYSWATARKPQQLDIL
jgi:hypothetical protein